jgi:hypothetical protein
VNWYLQRMFAVEIDPEFCLFMDKASCHEREHVNSQSNSYRPALNSVLIHGMPSRDMKVGVWCVMN